MWQIWSNYIIWLDYQDYARVSSIKAYKLSKSQPMVNQQT